MSTWKRTFYAAFAAQLLSITGFSFVLPFMPFYLKHLGVTGDSTLRLWTGLVSAATPMTMVVFSPLWGLLADRFGRKPMVLRSMFSGALVLLLMAFARNEYDLLILRMLQGALTGTVTASVALVASVAPEERSGYALGMMQAAVFIGVSAGPLVGGFIADSFGYRVAFFLAAAVLAAGGLMVKFFACEQFTPAPPHPGGHLASFGEVFAATGFLVALLALFHVRFANSASGAMFPLLVRNIFGADKGVATVTGLILALSGFTAAIASGLFGHIGDSWGHARLLALGSLAAALVTVPMAFATSIPQLYVLRGLFGFSAAAIMPSANAIIRRISHDRHLGKAYGVTASVNSLGLGLGPLTGGWMAATFGLRTPFILTGAILLLTAGLVRWRIK